jgi:hypothetical protein
MTKRTKPRVATKCIYLAQHSRAKWIGAEAINKNAAIEEAELFKASDPTRLIAARRRQAQRRLAP